MNIEETKAAIAVMQAFVDGKDIESLHACAGYVWLFDKSPHWSFVNTHYRVRVTKPSINWDHVAPEVVAIATDRTEQCYTYADIPKMLDVTWCGDDIGLASAFASFVPGTCDWKDSLVVRPGYEGEKP